MAFTRAQVIREDQASIRVTLAGAPLFDNWATAAGGGLTAADGKTRPGGMGSEMSVGGQASRDDLTCTIQFTDPVASAHKGIEGQLNAEVVVTVQWLNGQKKTRGTGQTRKGTLKSATEPDTTNESSNTGMYTIIVSCDEDQV